MKKLSPTFPFDPKNAPVYYGWLLIPLAILGVLMSMPGQTAGFSAFTEPLIRITHFSRTRISTFYLIGTVISGFLLPTMGNLLDEWGARKMMIFASVMLGLTLLWLSYIDKIVQALGGIFGVQLAYSALLILGIFSLRFFGQGLLTITSNTMIGKWFDAKRGRAMALLGVANSFAFSVTPAVMAAIVAALAWNGAWRALAAVVGVGMSITAFLFFRDTPEACGLPVDGQHEDDVPQQERDLLRKRALFGLTRHEAIRTRAFWALIITMSSQSLVTTGLTFHIQEIGEQAGLPLAQAVAIFIPVSFIAVPLSFLAAIMTERVHAKYFVFLFSSSQILSYISVAFLDTTLGYVLTIIGMGVSGGLMGPMQTAVMPKVFGRKHLGSISGMMTSFLVIGSALGPVLLSLVNDLVGSLSTGVNVMVILPIISFVCAIGMKERFRTE
jgi:sugar phosphate permease